MKLTKQEYLSQALFSHIHHGLYLQSSGNNHVFTSTLLTQINHKCNFKVNSLVLKCILSFLTIYTLQNRLL